MKIVLQSIVASALLTPSLGQIVLFEDTFDTGMNNWIASVGPLAGTPLWHWVDETNPCAQSVLPLPSQGGAVRMGDADCTFSSIGSFHHVEALDLVNGVYIPEQADTPMLTMESYADSELCGHWDNHWIFIRVAGTIDWEWLGSACTFGWNTPSYDLSDYRGESVEIRFAFHPVDTSANQGLGWIIDDVRITTADCIVTNYCDRTPNSASTVGARIGRTGTVRLHLNNLVLTVDDAPPGQFASFFCGSERTQSPLGDGTLCVGGGTVGLIRLGHPGVIDAQGHIEFPFDTGSPLLAAGEFLPGSNWNFQCWFRDGQFGQFGSNLSDALSITFCP